MYSEINFAGIKDGAIKALEWTGEGIKAGIKISGEWLGRAVTLIKSGWQNALPYLKDVRIAAVSLFAVNLLFIEISDLFSILLNKILPSRSTGQQNFKAVVLPIAGLAVWFGGVGAFCYHAGIPSTFMASAPAFAAGLPGWAIAAIGIGTIGIAALSVRMLFSKRVPE